MIIRVLMLTLSIGSSFALSAQKAEGVYVGELIMQNNALVLTAKGQQVKGNVCLSEFEKFEFVGNLKGDSIKGVILVSGTSEVVLLGKIFKDSISASLISDDGKRSATLIRISSNPNYELRRYFGDRTPERDPMLVGRWNLVRKINHDGKEIPDLYFYDYLADGETKIDITRIRRAMEDIWRRASVATGQQNKFTFDERSIPKMTWQTVGRKLIITTLGISPTGPLELDYIIMNDTLTITNVMGGKEILVRDNRR